MAFFDELLVDKFSRLELDAMPSHIGVHLPLGFMYRKPRARLESKLDRIVEDAKAYESAKTATANVDRNGEIWLAIPEIPNPKHPKLCLLPWKDPPSVFETHFPEPKVVNPQDFVSSL